MPRYTHQRSDQPPCLGVLLTNLGTPDAPTPKALRRYLAEFLSDPRVVETNRLLWWPVLHGIVLRLRPRRAAEAYASVWTEGGAPLLAVSRRQAAALQQALAERMDGPVRVALAMRYGKPSIRAGLEELRAAHARRILLLPLYPQYSASTTGSTFDALAEVLTRWRVVPELRTVADYHDEAGYIGALAQGIRRHWEEHGPAERLLFSFHGLPKRYVDGGDPYRAQCERTAALVAETLDLDEGRWQLAFQSRFGPEEWLKPYTDKTLKGWGKEGVKSVEVICPGFAADCLETLEEIAVQNKELFQHAGGGEYRYIACLNDQPHHIEFLAKLVQRHCQGWGT
ncbi:MAG: ferrochelatase [Gammaproteobacteria bacterium]|nr:ferrochelatase [Gammaproteobacteria bacterium]NIR98210.1 ferrochelatase [Gammaproteobacteria bacterium]NIT63881.1 ferrochelatase [Gammaproteobacteria bacterium]NIV20885.1 ferrochelatase [Gammaproteobacteria bacterium]NIY32461.1 ferrochelatase [Gammaproteobacteria bacterium]